MPTTPQALPRLPPPTTTNNNTSTSTSTNTTRWRSLTRKDPTNAFVYAVRTTNIYCRPSCPARLARRANVRFYDTPAQAETDGFRACKRCRPDVRIPVLSLDMDRERLGLLRGTEWEGGDGDGDGEGWNPQVLFVRRACERIRRGVEGGDGENDCSVGGERKRVSGKMLAREAGVSEAHFCRVFKRVMGVTAGEYISLLRGGGSTRKKKVVDEGDKGEVGSRGRSEAGAEVQDEREVDGILNHDHDHDLAMSAVADTNLWNEFDVLIAAEQGSLEAQTQPVENLAFDPFMGLDPGACDGFVDPERLLSWS